MTDSAFDWQLGLPTCIAGLLTAGAVLVLRRSMPWRLLRDISWGVLPLVAGLFVLVRALDQTGLIDALSAPLRGGAADAGARTAWAAGAAVQSANAPDMVTRAILIGVNLGPNLSVTGSLATILWLAALRREGQTVGAGAFLKLGLIVMAPALLLAIR